MRVSKIRDLHNRVTKELVLLGGDLVGKQQEAWWLLEALTEKNKHQLLAEGLVSLSQEQEARLKSWVKLRVDKKKPLQYILGDVPFCGLHLSVRPPVLIPRVETEEMTAWLIEEIVQLGKRDVSILDLCTGSGCIGLSLAKAFPKSYVVAVDCHPEAIALVNENKQANKITNLQVRQSDMFKEILPTEKFDIIVSNPPYLSEESYSFVSDEVRLWEDKQAFDGGVDGMYFYKLIAQQSKQFLSDYTGPLPRLVMEIGIDQKDIEEVLIDSGYSSIRVMYDAAGKRRWVVAAG